MGFNEKLNRQAIIGLCKKLSFDNGKYRLNYGSAMVMHGIRQYANDIDIDVLPDLFAELAELYTPKAAGYGGEYICIDGTVDVFECSSMDNEVVYLDGIPTASLACIIRSKRMLGRSKDLEDIKLIEAYIANKSS